MRYKAQIMEEEERLLQELERFVEYIGIEHPRTIHLTKQQWMIANRLRGRLLEHVQIDRSGLLRNFDVMSLRYKGFRLEKFK